MKKNFLIFFVLLFHFSNAQHLKLAYVFTDNMVIQRNMPIHIFGKGIPNKTVHVLFHNSTKSVRVKPDSLWNVLFEKQAATSLPQNLIIKCSDEKIEIKNILIGDVWICSGQSNMEFAMSREMHFKDEMKNSNQPLIRLFNSSFAGKYIYGVAYTDSISKRLNTNDFYSGKWETCDSNTIKPMSAVAYYFAKEIVEKEKIPIGLINLSIGGAPIETFISKEAMLNCKNFSSKIKGNWLENNSLPEWIRQRGKENLINNKNGFGDELGLNHAYKPGFAFECGIKPILSFPIKGVIWYQGESNSLELTMVKEYKELFKLMIEDYRKEFNELNMPFYYVQLSSIDTAKYKSQYWPIFRNEQRLLLNELDNVGMAVCSDIGFKNDVHPTDKKDVGERLAKWALYNTYHQKIIPSGPLPLKAVFQNNKIIVSFQYAAKQLQTADNKPVRGFSLDGRNDVAAEIVGDEIIINTDKKPLFIYYAWKPFTDADLVNAEMLPASTFKIKVQ